MELLIALIIVGMALFNSGCSTKQVAKNCNVSVDKENKPTDYFVCDKE